MIFLMSRLTGKQYQVIDRIIMFVLVYMVYTFIFFKRTSYMSFHYKSVLKLQTFTKIYFYITFFVYMSTTFPVAVITKRCVMAYFKPRVLSFFRFIKTYLGTKLSCFPSFKRFTRIVRTFFTTYTASIFEDCSSHLSYFRGMLLTCQWYAAPPDLRER